MVIMIMFHSSNHKCLNHFYLNEICVRYRHLFADTVSYGIRSMYDRILLLKRAIIETINDELKNIAQIEHFRHRSFPNFVVNLIGRIDTYCLFPKKSMINLERVYDNQLTLF